MLIVIRVSSAHGQRDHLLRLPVNPDDDGFATYCQFAGSKIAVDKLVPAIGDRELCRVCLVGFHRTADMWRREDAGDRELEAEQ